MYNIWVYDSQIKCWIHQDYSQILCKGMWSVMVQLTRYQQHFVTKNVKRKSRFSYDRINYGVFTFRKLSGENVNFNMHHEGRHYHKTKNRHVALFQTLSENEAGYRKHQLMNAKLSREVYSKVGHSLQNYFNKLINFNIISNLPVTLQDAIITK